jgi:prepilin signal peptidase PulO-like enzyme (type II secretory pathway)
MLLILSGVFGAALFGTAGWFGRVLSETCYGALERAVDGPLPLALPAWLFAALPAALGLVMGLQGVRALPLALLVVAVLSLSVCAATDLRTGLVPDLFTVGPLIVIVAVSAVGRDWLPLAGAAFALLPFAAIAALTHGRGMGWGDVKLAALGGALVGIGGITLAVVLASAAAYAVVAVTGQMRRPIAFGPYLAVSIGVLLGLGSVLPSA